MRKIALPFFVVALYAADILAAGDVAISRVIPGKSTGLIENSDVAQNDKNIMNRAARRVNTGMSAESKSVSTRGATRMVSKSADTPVNKNQSKSVNVISRAVNVQKNDSTRSTLEDGVNTVGRNARVDAAGINNTAAVRRAGLTLRTTTAEVGGRAKIIGTDRQTGSNVDEQVKSVHGRVSMLSSLNRNKSKTTPVVTADALNTAKDILEKSADLNNTCQQQYNECMDQFCAVVDDNQKRCSCSANIARYEKVQKAVEAANTELNDVAQRIRYVGLSADEIRAILSETEAEEAMNKTTDTSANRLLLSEIADMIKDPSATTSSGDAGNSSLGTILDLDFNSNSDSTEIFGLDMNFGSSAGDIAKKRGKDLYKEATKRCKSVLANCKEAGGTETQITGNYDLAIDKDCIAYEKGLDKLNKTLVSNVRSANLMLQKARLTVLQDKNQYDARGCVSALEKCMVDDMVCGKDYVKCLDPSKTYIDDNGSVVLGKNITKVMSLANKDVSSITADSLKTAYSSGSTNCQEPNCIINYLLAKIGTGATVKDGGLCRPVLDRCQNYTYKTTEKTSKYEPYNDVVVNYIQRAMANIKAAQSKIVYDYAAECLEDVSDCYSDQVGQVTSLGTTTINVDNIYNVMRGACRGIATTCGYALGVKDEEIPSDTCSSPITDSCRDNAAINKTSILFAESLLCPANSSFKKDGVSSSSSFANRTYKGAVNSNCVCNDGFSVWNGQCVTQCEKTWYRDEYGQCQQCPEGQTGKDNSNKDAIECKNIS